MTKLFLSRMAALCGLLLLHAYGFAQNSGTNAWPIFFEDDFKGKSLGARWTVIAGNWKEENGFLSGCGTVLSTTMTKTGESPGFQRMEFEISTDTAGNDLLCFFHAEGNGGKTPWLTVYSVVFRKDGQTRLYKKSEEISKAAFSLESGRKYRIILENVYGVIRCVIDGKTLMTAQDKLSIFGIEHDRVGFQFANPARVSRLKVAVKRLPNNLDLD